MSDITALDGALVRRSDGWYWRDGTAEPRVSDMRLSRLAPNFRCATYGSGECYVEVPHDWTATKYWPARRVDPDAADAIRELLGSRATTAAAIYAEGLAEALDDHRLAKHGYLVPIEQWDLVMGDPCGCIWDRANEDAILARARSLGAQR